MYCSNCGANVKGRFCSKCGAKVEEQTNSEQHRTPPVETVVNMENESNIGVKSNIVIRSENCTQLVEENKKASDKSSNSILTAAGVIGIIIMFSPYLFAVLDDKKLSQAEGLPLPIVFLILAMIIVAWIAVSKQTKAARELYNKYKEYCSTEVLVADERKIFGSTSKGEVTLTYEQIESVGFSPNVWSPSERKAVFPNDIFTVRDIAGNEFVFYSFSNCKELKTVIDMQLRSVRDDKMQ